MDYICHFSFSPLAICLWYFFYVCSFNLLLIVPFTVDCWRDVSLMLHFSSRSWGHPRFPLVPTYLIWETKFLRFSITQPIFFVWKITSLSIWKLISPLPLYIRPSHLNRFNWNLLIWSSALVWEGWRSAAWESYRKISAVFPAFEITACILLLGYILLEKLLPQTGFLRLMISFSQIYPFFKGRDRTEQIPLIWRTSFDENFHYRQFQWIFWIR